MPDVWRYTFQSTFITITEVPCSRSSKRNKSSPPTLERDPVPLGIFEAHKAYVNDLEQRVSQSFPAKSRAAAQATVVTAQAVEATPVEALEPGSELQPQSTGSLGHPELCARPCSFAVAGNCSKGQTCGYCHESHDSRPSHLDRRQREVLRRLETNCRLELLLAVMRVRAEKKGFSVEAAPLLAHLDAHLSAHSTPEERAQPLKPRCLTLVSALKRLTFTELVGLAVAGARAPIADQPEESEELEVLVRGAMTILRSCAGLRYEEGHDTER